MLSRLDNPPAIWSIHPASAATSQFASIVSADLILSSSIAHETSGNLTQNEPPKPTATIGIWQFFPVFRYEIETLAGRLVFSHSAEQVT